MGTIPTIVKHPIQPIVKDEDGKPRFKENAIVKLLLDRCQDNLDYGLNELDQGKFSADDWEQFYQLIGYSVDGWALLSGSSKESVQVVDMMLETGLSEDKARLAVLTEKLRLARKALRKIKRFLKEAE